MASLEVRHFFVFISKNERMAAMRRTKFLLIAILIISLGALGQTHKIPEFEQYSVKVDRSKGKAPNLHSHKDARLFRTNLRNAAKSGVNFAGHYALTYWVCGSSCGIGAIVDLRSGNVFFPTQLNGVWAEEWPGSRIPFGFRANGRLFILHGYLPNDYNGDRVTYGYHYYLWNGSKLKPIEFVRKDWRLGEN